MTKAICIQVAMSGPKAGKFVSLADADDVATLVQVDFVYNRTISSPRCAFIFVRNFPKSFNDRKFLEPHYSDEDDLATMEHELANYLDIPSLTESIADDLAESKQVTLNWGEFKTYCNNAKNNRNINDEDFS